MESFKIQHFEREHGAGSFPSFRTLSATEARGLFVAVRQAAGLCDLSTPEELVRAVWDKSIVQEGVQADRDDFSLLHLIHQLGLPSCGRVYLNWHWYEDVDEIRVDDLAECFSDIWYPAADDMDITDTEWRWVISIHHEGMVALLRLKE